MLDILFDTEHVGQINDIKYDFNGVRIATCSSDNTIKIFEQLDGRVELIAKLQGHSGAVFGVSWSTPESGSLLASCSSDKSVIIWKETGNNWDMVRKFDNLHKKSINTIEWAPQECGLKLAVGSSDGFVTIIQYLNGDWNTLSQFKANSFGVLGLSWAPFTEFSSIAVGGVNGEVSVWREENGEWKKNEQFVVEHSGWVSDVAWSPNSSFIASCSRSGEVFITSVDNNGASTNIEKLQVGECAWRLSWSILTNILGVAFDNNNTRFFDYTPSGWITVSNSNNNNVIASNNDMIDNMF